MPESDNYSRRYFLLMSPDPVQELPTNCKRTITLRRDCDTTTWPTPNSIIERKLSCPIVYMQQNNVRLRKYYRHKVRIRAYLLHRKLTCNKMFKAQCRQGARSADHIQADMENDLADMEERKPRMEQRPPQRNCTSQKIIKGSLNCWIFFWGGY